MLLNYVKCKQKSLLHWNNKQFFGFHGVDDLFIGLSTNQTTMNPWFSKVNNSLFFVSCANALGDFALVSNTKGNSTKSISYKIENEISAMKKHVKSLMMAICILLRLEFNAM
jgi:hypothetical protein